MFRVVRLLLMFVTSTCGSSNGVAEQSVCYNMTPIHGEWEPQNASMAPFLVIPHLIKVNRGQKLKVTLQSVTMDFNFKGFMIQARTESTSMIVGNFLGGKSMVCAGSYSTATHSEASAKFSKLLTWKAPTDYQGNIRFQ